MASSDAPAVLSSRTRPYSGSVSTDIGRPVLSDEAIAMVAVPIVTGIVAGMALGIAPLVAVASAGALLAAVTMPYAGLAVIAFTGPLAPPALVPAPGFQSLLVGAVLLGCVYRLPIERPRIRFGAPVIILFAFMFFVTMQQLPELLAGYASDADHAVGYLYFQILTGFGLISAAIWLFDQHSPAPILAMAIAGAVSGALIAVIPFVTPALASAFVNLSGQSLDPVRASGAFSNPNFFGGWAAISFAVTLGLLAGASSRRVQAALLVCAAVLAAAVLVSLSRGALITAFAGLLGIGFVRSRAAGLSVIAFGLLAAFVIYPAFVNWRLVNLTGSASAIAFQATAESDAGRLNGALAGLTLFQQSPITGAGFGRYLAEAVKIPGAQIVNSAHNWYTTVLGEQGLVGISLMLALAATLIGRVRKLPNRQRTVGITTLAALVAACLFLEVPTSYQTFVTAAIALAAVFAGTWPAGRQSSDTGAKATSARTKLRLRAA